MLVLATLMVQSQAKATSQGSDQDLGKGDDTYVAHGLSARGNRSQYRSHGFPYHVRRPIFVSLATSATFRCHPPCTLDIDERIAASI